MTQMSDVDEDFLYLPAQSGLDVCRLFKGAESVTIIAPFITKSGLHPIMECLDESARVDVVTRWTLAEVASGVSDPSIIEDVERTGGRIRLLPRLHAKVYLAGDRALLGSANPTGPGLGFSSLPNIEALVAISSRHPMIVGLVDTIDRLSSVVDADYARVIVETASQFSGPADWSAECGDPSPKWIPVTRVPGFVYRGYAGLEDREDYRVDLASLNAPPGLSEADFHLFVALALRQGLVGRVFDECEGLQQWQGIEKMLSLMELAGVVREEQPQQTWETLRNWFKYFLKASGSLNGGYSRTHVSAT